MAELLIATGAIAPKHMSPAPYVAASAEPSVPRGEYLAKVPRCVSAAIRRTTFSTA